MYWQKNDQGLFVCDHKHAMDVTTVMLLFEVVFQKK